MSDTTDDSRDPDDEPSLSSDRREPERTVGRRSLVGGLALGGVALGSGVAGGAVGSRTGVGFRRHRLAVEVACLGPTMRTAAPDNVTDDGDFRSMLLVEGLLFAPGTIPGDGFIPTVDAAIGHWICRGWFMNSAARPQPHLVTSQEYLFAVITPERLFPRDTISTTGIEGTDVRDLPFHRTVSGGTGRYVGATGEQQQSWFADNASLFSDGLPAPCFRVSFDLLLPD